jgi:hypothetical protein
LVTNRTIGETTRGEKYTSFFTVEYQILNVTGVIHINFVNKSCWRTHFHAIDNIPLELWSFL